LSAAGLARWPARSLLVGLSALRTLGAVGIAVAIALAWPTPVVCVLAALEATMGAPIRPSEATLMPAVARSPAELVAANVAWGSVEGLGSFGGPLVAGLVIALGAPVLVAVAATAGIAASAWVFTGLRFEQQLDAAASGMRGLRIADGARALRRPAVAWTLVGVFLQTVTRGLLNSLVVVASVVLLGLGDPGVGLLYAAMGIGGLLGGMLAMSLVRSDRLVGGVAAALAYWGLPIAFVGLAPATPVAVAALAAVGLANAAFDVAAFTIFQRATANDERGAAFAMFEGAAGAGVVIGSLLGPVFLAVAGPRGALVAAGAILPVFAALLYARVGGGTRIGLVDESVIRLLRRVPAFAELPLTALERLAAAIEPSRFEVDEALMRQGEAGDRFLVVESGEVEVSIDGQSIQRLGPGAGIGEIALLRRSPRTATVTALSPVRALGIPSDAFCAAIAGPSAGAVMERVAAAHLARPAGEA
ncbi:MAG TPA: cyclic nucleotide-binding domain-containing protein, partial [Candidatus Limnocylindrales bacterium]|nr:cyclic nucleotide-binding domain-containing protein [Candidatus Limnocylindrales bacterium]